MSKKNGFLQLKFGKELNGGNFSKRGDHGDSSFCAWIAEILDPKGLREGINKTEYMKRLTHSGRE
jgi:hypothetical protein